MLKNLFSSLLRVQNSPCFNFRNSFHLGAAVQEKDKGKWLTHNDKVYPPQSPDETPRPAFVCHSKLNIKYSYKKLWYIACLVRGMTVDEALRQLKFVNKKGAFAVSETILEAQKLAVAEHNVEYKSNLWVSESFVGKGKHILGYRRHAKGGVSKIRYGYTHYYVTLEEGTPPQHYYHYRKEKSAEEMLSEWLEKMRSRKIRQSL